MLYTILFDTIVIDWFNITVITAVPAPPAPSEPGRADSDLHPVQSVQVGGECPETQAASFLSW